MTTVNVQFADASKSKIISYFASPQDPESFENLGTVDLSSDLWRDYYESLPSLAQNGMPAPGSP